MAIAIRPDKPIASKAIESASSLVTPELVWQKLASSSFAVIGYVTPGGAPRSSGVVYTTVGKRLYTAVAPDSWKARHIAASKRVSVTVPVRRGGILSLVLPIPPATISFHAAAIAHPSGSLKLASISRQLESMVPADRRKAAVVIELTPEGDFLTYGLGVPLMDMQKPQRSQAAVPATR